MKNSHAADWPSDAPSPAQLKELFAEIASGRVTKDRLQAFLRGEVREMPTNELPVWSTWKTIYLSKFLLSGDYKITRMSMLRQSLAEKGYKVSDLADELLVKHKPEHGYRECEKGIYRVELVVVSVDDLGLSGGVTRKDIYDRAIELGLRLCPSVVGPQLRLQYENKMHKDQSGGECLLIAMEPIPDSLGRLSAFSVDHKDRDERWLNAHNDVPENLWDNKTLWVFLKSNK